MCMRSLSVGRQLVKGHETNIETRTAGQATAVVQLQGMDPPVGLDKVQQAAWLKDKQFLQQLMDNTKVLPAYCQPTAHLRDSARRFLYITRPVHHRGRSTCTS